ncbi:hypothetical protein GBAR_LOCUS24948, partial [Geodia barretti]
AQSHPSIHTEEASTPLGSRRLPVASTSVILTMSDQLGIDDFAEVQEALWEARSKWHNTGTRLKLGVFDLDCINSEPGFGLDDKFNLMIKTRLKRMEPCTWRDLYDALNHPTVDMPSVANKLTAKLPIVVALPAEQREAGVAKTSSISGGVQ